MFKILKHLPLLNASSFSKKQVKITITCYFQVVDTSHSQIVKQIMQHSNNSMTNGVVPDQPASEEAADLDPHHLLGNLDGDKNNF